MAYAPDAAVGVDENVKVEPPFDEMAVIEAELVDETAKSAGNPVDAPFASETEIVHEIGCPVRCGFMGIQTRLEAVVGIPSTINDCEPLNIVEPLT